MLLHFCPIAVVTNFEETQEDTTITEPPPVKEMKEDTGPGNEGDSSLSQLLDEVSLENLEQIVEDFLTPEE